MADSVPVIADSSSRRRLQGFTRRRGAPVPAPQPSTGCSPSRPAP
jgi:hypothetical protein